jgi:alcohol dehydrogenase
MAHHSITRNLKRRSLLVTAPHQAQWVQENIRQPKTDEVLVETIAGAISIGSELPQYRGAARSSQHPTYPRMTGYESYARIIAVGAGVSEKFLGETVIGFYGHRTHEILPFAKLLFAPSRIPPPTALLVILTCDMAQGIRKLQIRPDERVLVTGAGAIGLMTVWVLRRYGVQIVHVIEPDAERRERAITMGASLAASPDMTFTWSAEYPVAIECSSVDRAFSLLQDKSAAHGRICILSDGNIEPLTLSPHFHSKELTIIGSSDGWNYHEHAIWYWRYAEDDTLAKTVFDMTVSADELPDVFAGLATGTLRATKVLVNYNRPS